MKHSPNYSFQSYMGRINLTDYLSKQFDLYHFTEKVAHRSVDFDYKLKKGRLRTRNALRILELNGYPQEVIREAKDLAGEMAQMRVMNE